MKMKKMQKRRAAAYCRVSTTAEIQEGSFELQKQYFKELIASDEHLELVDLYGDFGKSGRNIEKRADFQRMIHDCRMGKIDIIYTKSVSRFSRNIADLSKILQELRKCGVGVYFEREAINSMDCHTELFLNILGIIAQEEVRSFGENVRMGLELRHATGHPTGKVSYGYRRVDEDANWEICEDEAMRVRLAFEMAAMGETYQNIKKALDFVESNAKTGVVWHRDRIRRMLTNVSYKGDVLTGKYYMTCGTNRYSKVNRGERTQYYLKGHHEPIVTYEVFERVQSLMSLGLLHSNRCRITEAERSFLYDESWKKKYSASELYFEIRDFVGLTGEAGGK